MCSLGNLWPASCVDVICNVINETKYIKNYYLLKSIQEYTFMNISDNFLFKNSTDTEVLVILKTGSKISMTYITFFIT